METQMNTPMLAATKQSLERAGYALLGLGSYVVDSARTRQTPDVLTDAGRALANGFERVEHRGRSAWPGAREAADDATAQTRKRAEDTSDRAKARAGAARDQATAAGEELRTQVRDAMTFVRTVAGSRTGVHASYADMTKSELYERAQDLDIDGRSEMDKDELVAALRRHDNPDFEQMTKSELSELASQADIDGRSTMTKEELVTALNTWLDGERQMANA